MNCLGIENVRVRNLFDDLKDGVFLLRIMDHIKPGCVDWKKAETDKKKLASKFIQGPNCQYALEVAKNQLGIKVEGFTGMDIMNTNVKDAKSQKIIFILMWQLMDKHLRAVRQFFPFFLIYLKRSLETKQKTNYFSGRTQG